MSTPPDRPSNFLAIQDRKRGLKFSLALHGGLAVFIVFKSLFFPGNPLPYVPTLRVDLVGLPDTLKNDLSKLSHAPVDKQLAQALKQVEQKPKEIIKVTKAPAEPKVEPDEVGLKKKANEKEETKPDPKLADKSREKKLKSALDRIKALEDIASDTDAPKAQRATSMPVKGNKISKGASLSGEARESDQVQYYDLLKERLQQNWSLPVWLARQQYGAQVTLFIDGRGNVRAFRFTRSSGNSQFDDAVKRAIQQSQPFDPPPESIASTIYGSGVVVGFPL